MIPLIGTAPAPGAMPAPEPAGPPAPTRASDRSEAPAAADTRVTSLGTAAVEQAAETVAVPADPQPSLSPPDPDAPTGPPPAFEASLLDRQREAGITLPTDGPDPVLPFIPQGPSDKTDPPAPAAPYDVPPAAAERAESDVATVRRIETPYDTATVDVAR
ncbi:MAG: hypothetical protein AAFX59_03505 [Pseudomonadota bacterium]